MCRRFVHFCLYNSYASSSTRASLSYGAVAILRPASHPAREVGMSDIVFLALGLVWFALCLGYAAGCERL